MTGQSRSGATGGSPACRIFISRIFIVSIIKEIHVAIIILAEVALLIIKNPSIFI